MNDEEMQAFLSARDARLGPDIVSVETNFLRTIYERVCALEAAIPKPGVWNEDGSWRCKCEPGEDENQGEEAPWMDPSWLFCSDCGTPRPDTMTRPSPTVMTHRPMSPSQLESAQAAVDTALRTRAVGINLGQLGPHPSIKSVALIAARDAEIFRLRVALSAIAYMGQTPDALARSVRIAQDALGVKAVETNHDG